MPTITKLPFAPPSTPNPVIWEPTTGETFQTKAMTGELEGRDLVIVIPVGRKRGLSVSGSPHHVVVIGGSIVLGNKTETILRIAGATGTVHIEGVLLDGGGANGVLDVVNVSGVAAEPWTKIPEVQIQNSRFVNVTGIESSENHTDCFQPQGSVGKVKFCNCTFESGYQGAFMPPQKPITEWVAINCNFKYFGGTTGTGKQIWMLEKEAPVSKTYPIKLRNVYCDPGTTGRQLVKELLYPNEGATDSEGVPTGAITTDGGVSAHFPTVTKINGKVFNGAPPEGDFAKAGEVGAGYVSPGYMSRAELKAFEQGEELMAVQTYTPDVPVTTGKVPTKREGLSAADTFTFVNNGKIALRATAGSTETKIKIIIQQKVDGITPTPREVVVKEATKLIGLFENSIYNNEEGKVEFTISSATGVVLELVEL